MLPKKRVEGGAWIWEGIGVNERGGEYVWFYVQMCEYFGSTFTDDDVRGGNSYCIKICSKNAHIISVYGRYGFGYHFPSISGHLSSFLMIIDFLRITPPSWADWPPQWLQPHNKWVNISTSFHQSHLILSGVLVEIGIICHVCDIFVCFYPCFWLHFLRFSWTLHPQ